MPAKPFPVDPASDSNPFQVTLAPLLDRGQSALAPDSAAGVLRISLSQIVLLWHNAFNEVTIRKADDLFACAARGGRYYDPIPKGAELVQATFEVRFADCPEPHAFNIAPPYTLTLQNPEDAARLVPLLVRRGFRMRTTNSHQ